MKGEWGLAGGSFKYLRVMDHLAVAPEQGSLGSSGM